MKFRTFTERIGEKLGPIDWQHAKLQGDGDRLQRGVQALRDIEAALAAGGSARATTSGGECAALQDVVDIGMYDGWPYWEPYPSVCLRGPLGPEWKSFDSIWRYEVDAPVTAKPAPTL